MGGGDAPPERVVEQDGDAVAGEDGQAHLGLVGNQAVRLTGSGLGWVGQDVVPGDRADDAAVNLVVFHQRLLIRPDDRAEPVEIPSDIFRGIPPVSAQVQAVPGCGGHTPLPGREAMPYPRPRRVGTGIKCDALYLLLDDLHGRSSCGVQN